MHGARVIALRGNFDQALAIVRELAERHPVELVNSMNPYRIEGQKTAAFEVCDELGGAPDALAIPVGNAGNITAWWRGFRGARGDARSCTGSRPRARRRSSTAVRSPSRETIASAIRIGNPARWEEAMDARDRVARRIAAVSDEQILDAYHLLARAKASSASPPRPPRWLGSWPTGCRRPTAASRPRRSSACSRATG